MSHTHASEITGRSAKHVLLAIAEEDRPSETREIELFLSTEVAGRLQLPLHDIDVEAPLTRYGIDSLQAIEIAHSAEKNLGIKASFEALVEGSSIREIADEWAKRQPVAPSLAAPLQDYVENGEYPLSRGQLALWFFYKLMPLSPVYNIAAAIRFRSSLDLSLLRRSLQAIVDRHPALRATFSHSSHGPVQKIHQHVTLSFQEEDAMAWDESVLNERMVEESNKAFDLENGPLFWVHVFSRSDDDHVVLMTVHHIVSDFWSLSIMLQELVRIYSAGHRGAKIFLEKPVRFTEYVDWQERFLASPEGEKHWEYWSSQLQGDLPELNLPADRPRPPVQSYTGGCATSLFDHATTAGLKRLGEELGVTLYTLMIAIYQVFLHRYSGQDDIIVGSPAMGRRRSEWAGVIGYFVNSLPLRAKFDGDPLFTDFLAQVRQTVLQSLEHQDYPFSLLVERLQPRRNPSRSPVFDTLFVFQKSPAVEHQDITPLALGMPGARLSFHGLTMESVALERQAVQFDLTLMVGEVAGTLGVTAKYNASLFTPNTIARMLQHLQTLAAEIVAAPDRPLSSYQLLTQQEVQQALVEWNTTEPMNVGWQCVSEIFERQVKLTPHAPAVAFGEEQLSYSELNCIANRFARHLRNLGVGPEVPVGIYTERGLDMIIAVLATMKAGGAYVPFDPAEPVERLTAMLEQVNPPVLLTQRNLAQRLDETAAHKVCLDDQIPADDALSGDIERSATGANLAYVIFTSGSTGRPRGVCIERRQLVNYVQAIIKRVDFPPAATFATVSTIAADLGNTMIFPALCTGGCLHIIPREQSLDPSSFSRYCERHSIDCLKIVPSHLETLLRSSQPVPPLPGKRLVLGGEASTWELIAKVRSLAPNCAVFNHYGPTETTVGVLTHHVEESSTAYHSSTVPVGHPLSGVQAYLLDQHLQPVAVGIPGELYIGGASVSRGYFGNPVATAEKFIPDPFTQKGGGRLYRTGDLVSRCPDGSIEFIGRADNQVKIRGYRIELGEVEEALAQHPAVGQAVVLVEGGDAAKKRLVAYLVAVSSDLPAAKELRQFLNQRLPEQMIPASFVALQQLPLTLNGKLDRHAVSQAEGRVLVDSEESGISMGPVERALAVIWSQLLGVENVGADQSFFELGGHSLMATQLISQLQEVFPSETPLLTLFFQNPTIAGLAEAILQGETRPEAIEETARLIETTEVYCENPQ